MIPNWPTAVLWLGVAAAVAVIAWAVAWAWVRQVQAEEGPDRVCCCGPGNDGGPDGGGGDEPPPPTDDPVGREFDAITKGLR